ncbi:MAG: hypothetical protein WEC00_09160, partial [Dongiaceae bacterium]
NRLVGTDLLLGDTGNESIIHLEGDSDRNSHNRDGVHCINSFCNSNFVCFRNRRDANGYIRHREHDLRSLPDYGQARDGRR